MSRRLIVLVWCAMCAVWFHPCRAEIPQMISYQGKVTDASGNPVANGSYTMRFRIYDAVSAGTLKWDSGARTVSLSGGIFDVLLGESPQPALTLDFTADYWLLVTFNGVDQSPRQRMAATGYAYMASGLVAGTEVSGSVTSGTSAALKGTNTAVSGTWYGVWGQSASNGGCGVYGNATSTVGMGLGVWGKSVGEGGAGVYGEAEGGGGDAAGGWFVHSGPGGVGVRGVATATEEEGCGVYGYCASPTGYAGYFQGHARVTGNLTVDGVLSGSGIGDITGVTAGTGLTGGGMTGDVTLSVAVPLELSGSVTSGSGAVIRGSNTATTGETSGVRGQSASPSGAGVYGWSSATTGTGMGVYGASVSTEGVGVKGVASATTGETFGGRFESQSTDGFGVYGCASSTTGFVCGVIGQSVSPSGRGVFGDAWVSTGDAYGVQGQSSSPSGRGVFGYALAHTGDAYGVYGLSLSTGGKGVLGWADATTGITYGVRGISESTDGTGVYGEGGYCGLYGYGTNGDGARCFSDAIEKSGVFGVNNLEDGAVYGVYGRTYSQDGYGVYSSGNFAASGTKSCVVKTSKGPTLMYCQESPENWFEDVGRGRLASGFAHIALDPLFLETVTIDSANPMEVFVQLRDDCRGVFVKAGTSGFDVEELQDGTSSAEFSYRVMAKRKGFEEKRLDYCKAAETDSYLHPELREKELREHEAERTRMEQEQAGHEEERVRMMKEHPARPTR